MPFYSDEIIQELKNQADIALVIQQFLPLKKSGVNKYVGVCPFHDDHSPSMSVNSTLGIYKCFACGAGGDVFKFIQEHEKLDFKGAVEWVANFVGFALPNLGNNVNTEVLEERTMVRKLNELACEWFEQQLTLSPKALEYLNKRHVSPETRKQFHIGYAPTGREGLIGYAARNGFSPRDCVKAGLAVEKENGGIADKFRDRLMIAIQNLSGVVVAFGGRDLSDPASHNGIKLAKYMNSPETALYSKRDILFGLNHSRNAIMKENAVIIVEGYFDLISLYQSGVQNVVAASGTALTENHASILARYAKTAYLVFDGDAAGQNATRRSLEIVLPKGLSPKVFALSRPDGTKIDPDNFVNEQGPDAFRRALRTAEDWLSYLGRTMPNNSPEDRAAFITQAKTLIKSIENPELRNQYLKLVSERYSTTRSLAGIKVAHPKREKTQATAEQPAAPQVSVPWELLSPIEVRFANLLFRNPTLLDRAAEYFDMDFAASGIQIFDSPLIDEFIQSILAQYAETGAFSPRVLYESLSPQLQLFLEQLPDETWKTPNEILEFYDTLAVLTLNLCDRYKKLIPLDSEAGMRLRMQLNKFTQGIQIVAKKRKISAITPDVFAEQIIQSKTPLIELYTEINELAMNGGNAAQFNNAQFSQQVPAQSTTAQFNNTQFAIPQATTAAQPSSPQYAAPATQPPVQPNEMPPEMEAPPPFESDEQFASSEPPEEAPYDPNEEPYVPDDEPYVPDDDFGAMDDFG
ncbi:DNA primase [Fibrobacter sp. UWB3]|uniref:DNA primase n=1 Tax=Fibrobacter sp. UWB3 TaxID=1964357 RepID=UPI000B524092|nr:DNA primase [Fibrobacter sp. UWB3]OWV21387.1 DNA primase [Fibrobacter sp. UWB3]